MSEPRLRPMEIGDILDGAFRLYKNNFVKLVHIMAPIYIISFIAGVIQQYTMEVMTYFQEPTGLQVGLGAMGFGISFIFSMITQLLMFLGAGALAYSISKASLLRFTKALAEEWAQYNVCVNMLTPGLQHTAIWNNPELNLSPAENERRLQSMTTNMERWGELREAGLLAVFLASDAANFMTGEVIRLGGSGINGH